MFSMLQNLDAVVEPAVSKVVGHPAGIPSVILGAGASSEPAPQRRRLQLLPRSKPVGDESKASPPAVSESGLDDEATGETGSPAPPALSEAEIKAKIGEDTKEFFSIRMLDEAESYFSTLPTELLNGDQSHVYDPGSDGFNSSIEGTSNVFTAYGIDPVPPLRAHTG